MSLVRHNAWKFARLATSYFNCNFKLWRHGICTDSQPMYNSNEMCNETGQNGEGSITNNQDEAPASYLGKGSLLKKKFAVLFSYCGKNYFGLQRNSEVLTIEEELLRAMRKAEVISQENYESPYQLRFQRASRTDKGVSALRQIVSLFLPTDIDYTTVERINSFLPQQIRVMGIKRVTKAFDAKESCNARLYSYMLPTFAFCPVDVLCTEAYRLPKDGVDHINSVLKEYEGRHNFYNFTSQRSYEEASCYRHVYLCECGQPFIAGGLEFVVIRIKGQSFMLHQIRKMVAVVISIIRGLADINTIVKAFGKDKMTLPLAPGLGLMLEEISYDNYNWKCGDGMFEPVLWDEHQDEVHDFREKYVRPVIVETEIQEKSMLKWLQELFCHTFEVRDADEQKLYYVSKLYGAAVRLKIQDRER